MRAAAAVLAPLDLAPPPCARCGRAYAAPVRATAWDRARAPWRAREAVGRVLVRPADGARSEGWCWACATTGDPAAAHALPPELAAGLRGYQVVGAAWLAASRGALLADDTGLGKTAQVLRALAALGHPPALVVAPAAVRAQWPREAERWAPGYVARAWGGGRVSMPAGPGELVAIGYPQVRAADELVAAAAPGLVVVYDEAEALKNPASRQGAGARALTAAALARGGRAWALTATPVRGRLEEYAETLAAAGLAAAVAAPWPEDARPADVMPAVDAVRLRRTAREAGVDLPPLLEVTTRVQLDAEEAAAMLEAVAAAATAAARRRAGREAAAAARAKVAAAGGTPERAEADAAAARAAAEASIADVAPGALSADLLARLAAGDDADADAGDQGVLAAARRAVAEAKIPAARALCARLVAESGAVVAFSAHRGPVEALGAQEGWTTVVGGQPPRERAEALRAFVAGERVGLAATLACCAAGVDGLQRRAAHAVCVDRDWTPAVMHQAQGRLRRLGQEAGAVVWHDLVAEHWIEDVLAGVVARKAALLAEVGLAPEGRVRVEEDAYAEAERAAIQGEPALAGGGSPVPGRTYGAA